MKDIGTDRSVQLNALQGNMETTALILALIVHLLVQHAEIHQRHAFHVKVTPYIFMNMIA